MAQPRLFSILKIESAEARKHGAVLLGTLVFVVSCAIALTTVSQFLRVNAAAPLHSLCPFLNVTGVPCPFCGLTRSLFSLLHGDLIGALWYHSFGPMLWGGTLLIGCFSLGLAIFKRKISTSIPQRVRTKGIVVTLLILWCGRIFLSHP